MLFLYSRLCVNIDWDPCQKLSLNSNEPQSVYVCMHVNTDLHRDFVSAIFDVGLKHSSPSAILEHMPQHEQITTERIKSHLQKYRLHRIKSKKEFISSYEASVRNYQQQQPPPSNHNHNHNPIPPNNNHYYDHTSAAGSIVSGNGEVAAHLTAASLAANSNSNWGSTNTMHDSYHPVTPARDNPLSQQQHEQQQQQQSDTRCNDSLMLPQLTEAEKESPIGSAMGYLMGLFFSLKQQLMIQRSLEAAGEKAKGNPLFPSTNATIANTPFINHPTATAAAAAATTAASAAAAASAFAVAGVGATASTLTADGNADLPQYNLPQPPSLAPQQHAATIVEENSIMKREMQNQMALQNKMRALKEQELSKYKNTTTTQSVPLPVGFSGHYHYQKYDDSEGEFAAGAATGEQQQQQQRLHYHQHQGAGEITGKDPTAASVATTTGEEYAGAATDGGDNTNTTNLLPTETSSAADDFWHDDVVGDQLFEFLMDH